MVNNLRVKYTCIFVILLIFITFSLYSNENRRIILIDGITFIQEDYTRNDLYYISGISTGNEYDELLCVWKISPEELDRQNEETLTDLIDRINFTEIIEIADHFISNFYNRSYSDLRFESIEYFHVNNERYGTEESTPRNDWIIVLNYYNDEKFNERVFMLPDKKIIISSNNYEEIIFGNLRLLKNE